MSRFGFRCLHCARPLAVASHGFCSRCIRQLTTPPYCQQCGSPLPAFHSHCGLCLQQAPQWQRIIVASRYTEPMNGWIHRFKFQRHDWLDTALARLLLLAVCQQRRERYFPLPQVLLPVPLFWQRRWHRGYNQAEKIAKRLSQWLHIPVETQSLTRTRATRSQRELSAHARRQNVKDAFKYCPKHPYTRVALIDDVITTGSTLNAICTELKKYRIDEIQVWVIAKAD